MFDAALFRSILPDRVKTECEARPEMIPVVLFRLADGATLDVCHVPHLADKWMAEAHFRDADGCEDMDIAFIGFKMVIRVNVSLHHQQTRKFGFDLARAAALADADGHNPRVGGTP